MRRFTNSEAIAVFELETVTRQIREMESTLRKLKKEQKIFRSDVKQVIEEHGEAHNSNHMVTISPNHRAEYTVLSNTFDKFNIEKR